MKNLINSYIKDLVHLPYCKLSSMYSIDFLMVISSLTLECDLLLATTKYYLSVATRLTNSRESQFP